MTDNCRVFKNEKTFEYDMGLDKENAKYMIEIILANLDTDGSVKTKMEKYLKLIEKDEEIENNILADDILKQLDGNYIGKGLFAQFFLEKIDEINQFVVPQYIRDAINFVLDLPENYDDKN